MKASYPVEAFLLGMAFFSITMKEAFITGSLVLVSTIGTVLFYEGVKDKLPEWSSKLSTIIIGGAICAESFEWAFYYLGIDFLNEQWVVALLIGILCALRAMSGRREYGQILWESAVCFGIFLLLAAIREYSTTSTLFGYRLKTFSFSSKAFGGVGIGCLVAAWGSAMVNACFKINEKKGIGFSFLVPIFLVYPPMTLASLPTFLAAILGILFAGICFWSIEKKIFFSDTGGAMQGGPIQFVSLGFLYMILSAF